MGVKLKEIAEMTGTSIPTVYRVISGYGNVKNETRIAIEQAIAETGYHIRRKSTASKKSMNNIVLIIVESIANDVYVEYIDGIYEILVANGKYPYVYVTHRSADQDIEQLEFACKNRFLGVLLLSAVESPKLIEVLKDMNCPFVTINRYLRSLEADMVVMDNYKIGFMATNLLIQKGHKSISHLAGPENSSASQDRLRGYKDALIMAGLTVPAHGIYHGNLSYQSGCDYAKYFLQYKDEFTAIFSVNDTMAVGAIDTLNDFDLLCPRDYSIICADNTLRITTGKVKITSIGFNSMLIGKSAAQLLLERAEDPNGHKKTISYSPQIIERSSIQDLNQM